MKVKNKSLIIMLFFLAISYMVGYFMGQGNQGQIFGKTGAPKNCRALITANIQAYMLDEFSAGEALSSIDRNCGPNGLIWNER